MNYPKINLPVQEKLLFDIGYSFALLHRCRDVLSLLDDFEKCAALLEEIDAFMAARQQTTKEIYDAADKLFQERSTK